MAQIHNERQNEFSNSFLTYFENSRFIIHNELIMNFKITSSPPVQNISKILSVTSPKYIFVRLNITEFILRSSLWTYYGVPFVSSLWTYYGLPCDLHYGHIMELHLSSLWIYYGVPCEFLMDILRTSL